MTGRKQWEPGRAYIGRDLVRPRRVPWKFRIRFTARQTLRQIWDDLRHLWS